MGVNSTPELSETTKVVTKLLDFNFSTCLLELALDRLSLLLGDTLLNGLGSTVDQRLGIAQRQTCDLLNDLDHLEFRLTCVFQDDIERRLLGGSSLACACSGGCNGNSGSSRLNASLRTVANSFTSLTVKFTNSSASFFTSAIVVIFIKFLFLFVISFFLRASSRGPQSFGLH